MLAGGCCGSLSRMGSRKVNLGWERENSNNLPNVDIFMVTEFLKKEDRSNFPEMQSG